MRFQFGWTGDTPLEYPLKQLPPAAEGSRIVQPCIGKTHGVKPPHYPGSDEYHEEAEDVMRVRFEVKANKWPSWYLAKHHPSAKFDPDIIPAPLYDEGLRRSDPIRCAMAVHMDTPMDFPLAVLRWVVTQDGIELKNPETEHVNFLNREPAIIEDFGDAVKRNLRKIFEVKYHYGVPRVFEYFNLSDEVFVEQVSGNYIHPSYGAGHAAAAAAAKVLKKHINAPQVVWRVVFDAVYHWSFYRSLLGVHTAQDNKAGMAIGGYDYWDMVD